MGNSIAQTMSSSMAKTQEEMQGKMLKKQQHMQMRMQDRMRRTMVAQQMAFTRDLVHWMSGVYSATLVGVTAYTIKNRKFPKVAIVPLALFGTVIAYQADFAYGNKVERVNRMMNDDILTNKNYWFVPIDPEEDEEDEKDQKL
jgi:hypothetical protein